MKNKTFFTINIILLVWIFFSLPGCYDDKGNYDYIELDEIVIDTAGLGILSSYAVYRYDTLEIKPKVYYKGAEVTNASAVQDELEITWSIFQGTVGGTVYSRDTLSYEINLLAQITKPSGLWVVHLCVHHLETGVEAYQRFSVQVDETISDGWMVLYERDGNTEVGLIVDEYIKNGVVKERTFADLITAANSAPLSGEPMAFVHSTAPLSSGEVLIASSEDMVGVDNTSFEITYPFENLFWTAPATKKLSYVLTTPGRKEIVINDNKIHNVDYMSAGLYRINYFGEPSRGNYGQLANWSATYISSSFEAVAFDKDNRRFVCIPYNSLEVSAFQSQDKDNIAFDVNDVGMDFLASDWGRNYWEYTIVKNGNEYALLASNFYNSDLNKIGVGKYNMSDCPGISTVQSMAAALDGEFIYYASGKELYTFKYNANGLTENVWSAPGSEQITCVRLQKFYHLVFMSQDILINKNEVIYISTWDESAQNGKVYMYKVNPANGSLDNSTQKIKTGFGKIKDMAWKWTM